MSAKSKREAKFLEISEKRMQKMTDVVNIVKQQIALNSLLKVVLTSEALKKSFRLKKKVARLIDVTKKQTFDEDIDTSSDFDDLFEDNKTFDTSLKHPDLLVEDIDDSSFSNKPSAIKETLGKRIICRDSSESTGSYPTFKT